MVNSYLAELRKSLGMSQRALAEEASVSVGTIRKWEKEGFSEYASGLKVTMYAKSLKCSMDTVVHFNDLQRKKA